MAGQKFHINKNGDVKECRADVRACRFGGDSQHFTNEAAAWEAAEAQTKADNPDEFGTVTRKEVNNKSTKSAVDEELKRLITEKSSRPNMTPEQLQEVGEIFEKEVEKRLTFNPWDHELSHEELTEIQSVNGELFSSLVTNGGDLPVEASGAFHKKLNLAVSILPDNVKDSMKNIPMNTKYLHGNFQDLSGRYSSGNFEQMVPGVEKVYPRQIPENAPDGAILPTETYTRLDELENPNSAQRMFLKEGNGDQMKSLWLGAPMRRKGFKKIANSAEVFINGKTVTINKPLYELSDRLFTYGSEIELKKGLPADNEMSVLLHEYCHAVQHTSDISPKFQEAQMFAKIAGKRSAENEYEESYHSGFPDAYMGHPRGNELLPVSTEGLFHPKNPGNNFFYGSDRGENAHEVRRWVTGLWLSLANTKPSENTKPENRRYSVL